MCSSDLAAAACTEDVTDDSHHVECGGDAIGWWDDSGTEVCADLGQSPEARDSHDPGAVPEPPAPLDVPTSCRTPTPLPDPTPLPSPDPTPTPEPTPVPGARVALAPACPPDLYITGFKKFSGPLAVGGQNFEIGRAHV